MMQHTTDTYARLDPRTITVSDERQRTNVDLDEPFLSSIRERGIYTPLLVTHNNVLVAGGRRLAASLALSLDTVPVRYVSEQLVREDIELIELEENVRRKELTWQDEACAVSRLHALYCARDEHWTQAHSGKLIGSQSDVALCLRVAKALSDKEESVRIAHAPGIRAAYNICVRIDERSFDAIMDDIGSSFEEMESDGTIDEMAAVVVDPTSSLSGGEVSAGEHVTLSPATGDSLGPTVIGASPPTLARSLSGKRLTGGEDEVLCLYFHEWASAYRGPKFNFLHCDFPYGKQVFSGEWGGKAAEQEFKYEDDPSTYWKLCETLTANLDNFLSPTAHVMFWLSSEISMMYETIEFFRQHAPSLIFQKRALVWHKSDNTGIVPDPRFGPRWTYEVALMATRGQRLLVRPLAGSYSAPTARSHHPSTKPEPVLRHFFSMFVDRTTRMFDPTCGAGSALRAADSLNASAILGIEKSEDFALSARKMLRAARNMRQLTEELA